jgi:hypothetical protein
VVPRDFCPSSRNCVRKIRNCRVVLRNMQRGKPQAKASPQRRRECREFLSAGKILLTLRPAPGQTTARSVPPAALECDSLLPLFDRSASRCQRINAS